MTFTVDALLDLWGQPWQRGPEAEDAFRRLYADPVLLNGTPVSAATLVDRAIALQAALADQRREVLHVVETPGAVAVAFRLTGRHVGPLATKAGVLPPTHRTLTLSVMDILVLEDDRVSRIWMVGDELGTLAALDAVALRPPAGRPATSLSFLGVRTDQLEPMRRLYADAYGLPVLEAPDDAAWFGLADGAELHVYGPSDEHHRFFGSAPVVGLLVEDYAATTARLEEAGVEWLTEPDRRDGRVWRHYRAPDGCVYEVMGPDRG